ncbi:MAG: amidohydrolase [Betaproteobacteria bacterium RIFCSPLOWO2_02_FULL_62_17]|nr:MAG: amidohydrolase [Betaproteobacteria bacterium RIFCSPLOWO2_02_FULL_62_17]
MIIDCHGHVSAPAELWAYKATILAHRGAHGKGGVNVTDEQVRAAANKKEMAPLGHLDMLKKYGTDRQLISPRPFQMMHSQKPARLVHWFTEEVNTMISRSVQQFPDIFIGVGGLPQAAGEPIANVFPELERCIKQLGFKGCLLNPDPFENSGSEAPPLGEHYWYPLYEKLCELDVPAHIHATGSHSERTPYTLHFINEESIAVYGLVNSNVLKDFPNLKIVVSHGGGCIPYQLGRFQSGSMRGGPGKSFRDGMRKLYYDTVLYTEGALRLLIETVGPEQCLFGAECPGVGSAVNPETGETFDNVRPMIENFDWLSAAQKKMIFEDNARRLFKL